jgi:hypothetical protein
LHVPIIGVQLCDKYIQTYAKRLFTKIVKHTDIKKYYTGGKLHRDDLPAVIYMRTLWNIHTEYYKHGKLHRDHNAPAYIYSFLGGQIGPYKAWFINGIECKGKKYIFAACTNI